MDKIQLPSVTAIAVDCTDRIRDTLRALKISMEKIDFGEVIVLTNRKPIITKELPEFYTYKHIKKIENINQYNEFMFLELYKYFNTSHCLTIQDHAYVLHPEVWDNGFLNYDYIGAPWPVSLTGYIANTGERIRVGNGGFSLRSKKLCEIPAKNGWELREEQGFYNEDGNICCYYRKELLELGIKYAPIEVASRFSYENLVNDNYKVKPFGFHRNNPTNIMPTWKIK